MIVVTNLLMVLVAIRTTNAAVGLYPQPQGSESCLVAGFILRPGETVKPRNGPNACSMISCHIRSKKAAPASHPGNPAEERADVDSLYGEMETFVIPPPAPPTAAPLPPPPPPEAATVPALPTDFTTVGRLPSPPITSEPPPRPKRPFDIESLISPDSPSSKPPPPSPPSRPLYYLPPPPPPNYYPPAFRFGPTLAAV